MGDSPVDVCITGDCGTHLGDLWAHVTGNQSFADSPGGNSNLPLGPGISRGVGPLPQKLPLGFWDIARI